MGAGVFINCHFGAQENGKGQILRFRYYLLCLSCVCVFFILYATNYIDFRNLRDASEHRPENRG